MNLWKGEKQIFIVHYTSCSTAHSDNGFTENKSIYRCVVKHVDSVQIKCQIRPDKHAKEDGNTILKGIFAHL